MNIKSVTETEQIANVDEYLASGNGRGALRSRATVYDDKVGYFCVQRVSVEGIQKECILFVCAPHNDIVITEFPAAKTLE